MREAYGVFLDWVAGWQDEDHYTQRRLTDRRTHCPATSGHSYRPGLRYVFLLFCTRYEHVEGELTEYAVMAESGEGWRFGGGNILNRPMGETSVIMTLQDESRYRQSFQ